MVRREAEPEEKSPLDSLPIKLVSIETTTPKILSKEIANLQNLLENEPRQIRLPSSLLSLLKSNFTPELINSFQNGTAFLLQLSDPDGKLESEILKMGESFYKNGLEAFKTGDQILILNRNYVPEVPRETLETLTTALLEAKSQIPESMETAKKLYDYVLLFVELYGKGDSLLKLSAKQEDPVMREIAQRFLHAASITPDLIKAIIEERPHRSQERTFEKIAFEAESAFSSYSVPALEDPGKARKQALETALRIEARKQFVEQLSRSITENTSYLDSLGTKDRKDIDSHHKSEVRKNFLDAKKLLENGKIPEAQALFHNSLFLLQFYLAKDNGLGIANYNQMKKDLGSFRDSLIDVSSLTEKQRQQFKKIFLVDPFEYSSHGFGVAVEKLLYSSFEANNRVERMLKSNLDAIRGGKPIPNSPEALGKLMQESAGMQERAVSLSVLLSKTKELTELKSWIPELEKSSSKFDFDPELKKEFLSSLKNLDGIASILLQNYTLAAQSHLLGKPLSREQLDDTLRLEAVLAQSLPMLRATVGLALEVSKCSSLASTHPGVAGITAVSHLNEMASEVQEYAKSPIRSSLSAVREFTDLKNLSDPEKLKKVLSELKTSSDPALAELNTKINNLNAAYSFSKDFEANLRKSRTDYNRSFALVSEIAFQRGWSKYGVPALREDPVFNVAAELRTQFAKFVYPTEGKERLYGTSAGTVTRIHETVFEEILDNYAPEELFSSSKKGDKIEYSSNTDSTSIKNFNNALVALAGYDSLIWPYYLKKIFERASNPKLSEVEEKKMRLELSQLISTKIIPNLGFLKEMLGASTLEGVDSYRILSNLIRSTDQLEGIAADLKSGSTSVRMALRDLQSLKGANLDGAGIKIQNLPLVRFDQNGNITGTLVTDSVAPFREKIILLQQEHLSTQLGSYWDSFRSQFLGYTAPILIAGSTVIGGAAGALMGGPPGLAAGAAAGFKLSSGLVASVAAVSAVYDTYYLAEGLSEGNLEKIDLRLKNLGTDLFWMLPMRYSFKSVPTSPTESLFLSSAGSRGAVAALNLADYTAARVFASSILSIGAAVKLSGHIYDMSHGGKSDYWDIIETIPYIPVGTTGLFAEKIARYTASRSVTKLGSASRTLTRGVVAAAELPSVVFKPMTLFAMNNTLSILFNKNECRDLFMKAFRTNSTADLNAAFEAAVRGSVEISESYVWWETLIMGGLKPTWEALKMTRFKELIKHTSPAERMQTLWAKLNYGEVLSVFGSRYLQIDGKTGGILSRKLLRLFVRARYRPLTSKEVGSALGSLKPLGVTTAEVNGVRTVINKIWAEGKEIAKNSFNPGATITPRLRSILWKGLKFAMFAGGVAGAESTEKLANEVFPQEELPVPSLPSLPTPVKSRSLTPKIYTHYSVDVSKLGEGEGGTEELEETVPVKTKGRQKTVEEEVAEAVEKAGEQAKSVPKFGSGSLSDKQETALGALGAWLYPKLTSKYYSGSGEPKEELSPEKMFLEVARLVEKARGLEPGSINNMPQLFSEISKLSDRQLGLILRKQGIEESEIQKNIIGVRDSIIIYSKEVSGK